MLGVGTIPMWPVKEERVSATSSGGWVISPVPGDGDARESGEGEGRQDVVGESCIARVGGGLEGLYIYLT